MLSEYINNSTYNLDYFYSQYHWANTIRINDYQILTVFWNIFLLFIPYVLVLFLIKYWKINRLKKFYQKIFAIILGLIWLLFIPNTAYIINDVRHLINYCPIDSPFRVCVDNAWMIMFFFTYASVGWVALVYLINQMKKFIEIVFNKKIAVLYNIIIIPAISLGVLLGLLNRWNSWEAFIYPANFLSHVLLYFKDFAYFNNWLIFTLFLYLLYFGGDFLFKDKINIKRE